MLLLHPWSAAIRTGSFFSQGCRDGLVERWYYALFKGLLWSSQQQAGEKGKPPVHQVIVVPFLARCFRQYCGVAGFTWGVFGRHCSSASFVAHFVKLSNKHRREYRALTSITNSLDMKMEKKRNGRKMTFDFGNERVHLVLASYTRTGHFLNQSNIVTLRT